jgi:hypothetical protein
MYELIVLAELPMKFSKVLYFVFVILQYLFIPMNKVICAYDVETWSLAYELTDLSVTEVISSLPFFC